MFVAFLYGLGYTNLPIRGYNPTFMSFLGE